MILNGNGKKSKLIQALFEPQTRFSDSLTYDITSWALPYAYGLKAVASNQNVKTKSVEATSKIPDVEKNSYAYAAERKSIQDGLFLAALIKAGIRVSYNQVPLTNGGKKWAIGSVFILKTQNKHLPNLGEIVASIAKETSQEVSSLRSGLSDQGPDLGSNQLRSITNKTIGLLKSDNASPQGYGEVWHFFEQQLNYPIMQLSDKRLSERFLNKLDVLIVPPGYYSSLFDAEGENALSKWVKAGGRVIALGSAINAFTSNNLFSLERKKGIDATTDEIAFNEQERENIRSVIYGSIYKANVDSTHPLAAGYTSNYFTLKTSAAAYSLLKNNGTAAYLSKNVQPVAGFSGDKAIKLQSESLLFGTERVGRGSVVYFVDNPLYRSFWENGKLWLINAIFM